MFYLYLKQHETTGLKYLGYTKQDPFTYGGSGLHWKRHIAKHGKFVRTTILVQSSDINHIVKYGLFISDFFNIVESEDWANLKKESGNGGFNQTAIQSALLTKYGVTNAMHIASVVHKNCDNRKASLLNKYGVDNAAKLPHVSAKISDTMNDTNWLNTTGAVMRRKQKEIKDTVEWKEKTGKAISAKKNDPVWKASKLRTCPHCGKTVMPSNFVRWHDANCKKKLD